MLHAVKLQTVVKYFKNDYKDCQGLCRNIYKKTFFLINTLDLTYNHSYTQS